MKTIAFLAVLGGTFALLHDGLGTSYTLASVLAWVVALAGAFLFHRRRAYRAGFRVERWRSEAERLRASDRETYDEILETARGSEAAGPAERDPIAYVALWLSHAAEARYAVEQTGSGEEHDLR